MHTIPNVAFKHYAVRWQRLSSGHRPVPDYGDQPLIARMQAECLNSLLPVSRGTAVWHGANIEIQHNRPDVVLPRIFRSAVAELQPMRPCATLARRPTANGVERCPLPTARGPNSRRRVAGATSLRSPRRRFVVTNRGSSSNCGGVSAKNFSPHEKCYDRHRFSWEVESCRSTNHSNAMDSLIVQHLVVRRLSTLSDGNQPSRI